MSIRIFVKLLLIMAFCFCFGLFLSKTASAQSTYTYCADEGQRCNFSGTKDVFYGAQGKNTYVYSVTGGIDCNNNTFGDPIPGVAKRCFVKDSLGQTYLNPVKPHWEKYQGALFRYTTTCALFGGTLDSFCDVFEVHIGWNYIDSSGNEQVGWKRDANNNVVKVPLRDYQVLRSVPEQRDVESIMADPPYVWWIDYPSAP